MSDHNWARSKLYRSRFIRTKGRKMSEDKKLRDGYRRRRVCHHICGMTSSERVADWLMAPINGGRVSSNLNWNRFCDSVFCMPLFVCLICVETIEVIVVVQLGKYQSIYFFLASTCDSIFCNRISWIYDEYGKRTFNSSHDTVSLKDYLLFVWPSKHILHRNRGFWVSTYVQFFFLF